MLARSLLTCSLLLLSGCSLALVKGPPDFIPAEEQVPMGSCTIERVMPMADAIGAGAFLVAALTDSNGDVVRISAVLAGGLGFSSYTGFRRVKSCKERMFMPGGPVLDTVLIQPLDGIAPPLFGGPLIVDPLSNRLPPRK
ncbi:MAG: hypothetical protein OXE96_02350 [Gemmatimonadetes bacterium]|nr:hypothetical protein [Gemmatimonadota bacterium]